jgi:hypothetical protein
MISCATSMHITVATHIAEHVAWKALGSNRKYSWKPNLRVRRYWSEQPFGGRCITSAEPANDNAELSLWFIYVFSLLYHTNLHVS